MISIALLGCGRIGQVHARTISSSKRAKLVAVNDAFESAASALATETGANICSAEQIFADDSVDAVIICTPTDSHAQLIQQAALAGKAIMCEKPFDLSIDRIHQCMETVKQAGVPLMIGFNRRYDPSIANLQARLRAGEIGDIEQIIITSRDPSPPPLSYIKHSGGIFADMMIHDIDMARFLLAEELVEVQAVGSVLVDPEIATVGDFDTVAATLKTATGKICQISCSRRASYGYDQRLEVHGSKGMLRLGNIHETTVEIANGDGFQSAPLVNFFLERYMPAYSAELAYFIDCIETGVSPTPSGDDGLKAQIIAVALTKACSTGTTIKI
ncbi:MAG: inositol 2-dehydrogenase [Rhizobiales bacterium]|nr:inositol 2-dehydrogenase [Hyphomicrobiales bacterium]NRB13190.1 inositol 2-dehydrogenase [Hyphomicrobiales bacterium]